MDTELRIVNQKTKFFLLLHKISSHNPQPYYRMPITIIIYASVLAEQNVEATKATHRELFSSLEEHFDINAVMHQDYFAYPVSTNNLTVVLVATGGTEGMIVRDYDKLPHPLILLTDGKVNSLAATLELATWIRNKGDNCTILHGSMEKIISRLREIPQPITHNPQPTTNREQKESWLSLCRGAKEEDDSQPITHNLQPITHNLQPSTRIGVLGQPSDWLVASSVDYDLVKRKWGVEYIDIPLSKVEEYYAHTTDSDAAALASAFVAKAKAVVEPDNKEIIKAVRLYLALKRIADEYQLNALTIQCFSLITSLHTTGCLALTLLNDEGIVAGCEGDLQTIFTMLYAKQVMGKDSFMANPAFIDTDKNEVVFAHCTIGLKQTSEYIIRSHFESQSGVAIQGKLPLNKVTIMKFGGKALEKSVVLHGTIVENQSDERKCRTQIRIALDPATSHADYFLNESLGNHHVILNEC